MNREFKFKGWDGINMYKSEDLTKSPNYRKWLGKYDLLLLQYAGLKDKNGMEIYEGDVVKASLLHKSNCEGIIPTTGIVEYCEEYADFSLKNDAGHTLFHNHLIQTFEIIGNIYQNPELL